MLIGKAAPRPVFSFYADNTFIETRSMPTTREHCWHDTGLALMSMPAQHEQICCWCGSRRYYTYAMGNLPGHGTHAPHSSQGAVVAAELVYRGGTGPCAPA